MEIAREMISWLEFPSEVVELVLAPFLEMPRGEFPYVMQHHWRMRSLRGNCPIIVRQNGKVKIITIGELFSEQEKRSSLTQKPIENLEVWGRNGWKQIKYAFKHRIGKLKLQETSVRAGRIITTNNHSLFRRNEPIDANLLKIGDFIDLIELPIIQGKENIDKDFAWALGLYLAEGHKLKNSAIFSSKDKSQLERLKRLTKYGFSFSLWKDGDKFKASLTPMPFADTLIPARVRNRNLRPAYFKKVPSYVFTWDKQSKEAFLEGYLTGDGDHIQQRKSSHNKLLHWHFSTVSESLAQGIILLMKSLKPEIDFTIKIQENLEKGYNRKISKLLRIRAIDPRHNRTKERNEIIGIEKVKLLNPNIWVYDIETESHSFLAGVGRVLAHNSVHVDWRMATNDYLIGFTILDNPKGTPKVESMEDARRAEETVPFIFQAKNKNVGKRAETKARQPKEWLKVSGVVKPGEVGATEHGPGVFYIFDKGKVIFGVQKPYFHEYFVKSSMGKVFPSNTWTRIIVRRVGVFKLDPITKKPLKKREVMWRVLIPGDQIPYAISKRAIKKNYKPPKRNPTPFPIEWTKKNFSKQYAKWQEWIKGGTKQPEKKTCRTCFRFDLCTNPETLANPDREACKNWRPKEILSPAKFTLHFNSWMGQFVIRGVPKREWYLRIDDKGTGGIRSWLFEHDPLYFEPTGGEYEGRVDRKWLTFEGKLAPRTKYNPNKKIPAFMKIVDQGTVEVKSETEDGIEIIDLTFKGKKLRGKRRLVQEEKRGKTYTFEKLSAELAALSFVLQKHWIPLQSGAKWPKGYGSHFDIRFGNGVEFNLYSDPLKTEKDGRIKARRKTCKKIGPWMAIKKEHTFMKVGPLATFVDPIDKGKGEIYEMTPDFISMKFFGKKLKGYWVYRREASGEQFLIKSRLPKAKEEKKEELAGNPAKGDFFKPFRVEKKKGWNYFWLHIYSSGGFTRCVQNPKKYLPDLSVPSEVQEILVCLYRRPGTLHGARVRAIKVSDNWTPEQASDWVKKNKLHTWQGVLIREKREEKAFDEIEFLTETETKLLEKLAEIRNLRKIGEERAKIREERELIKERKEALKEKKELDKLRAELAKKWKEENE